MYLITAPSGSGKSTAIQKLINMLGPDNCCGFYAAEILENGARTGFRIQTLSGKTAVLASTSYTDSEYQIAEFGVDIKAFEDLCLPELEDAMAPGNDKYLIIDEIGPMQLYSEKYCEALYKVLRSGKNAVATIVYIDSDWTKQFKSDPDAELMVLTEENRDLLPLKLSDLLTKEDEMYQSKVRLAEQYITENERFTKTENEIVMHSTHDTRHITKANGRYRCTCPYYAEKGTCSHIMSVITMNLI